MHEDNVTPFLDITQLKKEEKNPDRVQKKVKKMILAKCHAKIEWTNKKTEFRECFFDIPFYMVGYPGYDLEDINHYLVKQLTLNGLYAERISPQRVYVSWKPEDLDYDQFETQSQKITPKPNIYKIGVSPLANDPAMMSMLHPGDKHPHVLPEKPVDAPPSPVMMLKYDDHFDDLVPVNSKRVSEMYPELSMTQNRRDSDYDHRRERDRDHSIRKTDHRRAPDYADRYNSK